MPATVKRALIICGLPGNEEYKEIFTESVTKIRAALTDRFGFKSENVRVQLGTHEEQPEPKGSASGRATRKEIFAEAKTLVEKTSANDLAWVFVISHAYFDGKSVFLNVPDTDISHVEFAESFKGLGGKNTAFFICAPVSGYFIKGLSKPGRVVITSSERDYETNGSIFQTHLANALTEISSDPKFDFDNNGKVSLVDLYIKTTRDLVNAYITNDPPLYPTEHPNFDDNGDGKGSELQVNFLTPQQGGRMGSKRRKRKMSDGQIAAEVPLPFSPNVAKPKNSAGVR